MSYFPQIKIPGLVYCPDVIAPTIEQLLTDFIDSQPWVSLGDKGRRVQNYGYPYQHIDGKVDYGQFIPIPEIFKSLGHEFIGWLSGEPNQVIVNEYLPGQGIGPHTDSDMPCKEVVTVSLLSGVQMDLRKNSTTTDYIWLERRSALVLYDEAFTKWKHGIRKTLADIGGPRSRRVSITMRHLVVP